MSDEIKNPNTEDEEYQPDLMTLEDEDGNEVTFEVIDALDHKGVHYLAVVEYTENEEDAEDAQLVILSVGEDDGRHRRTYLGTSVDRAAGFRQNSNPDSGKYELYQ